MPYYGLYIPAAGAAPGSLGTTGSAAAGSTTGGEQISSESSYVFHGKGEALEVLKLHKDARLREFISEDDAVKYAQTGYEVVQTKYSDVKTSTAALEKAAFRAPTKQELIEFRKLIEAGDYERVKTIMWDNPRYLVSSGDTPSTLKEGYRYNALHVCAISKKPLIAELILQTVSDVKFVDLLTGKKNEVKMCKELCANLLDYYLNIPEKGRSETPLHFASKNGCIEVIEVLTSYPECKMTPNNEGLLPKDIICSRMPDATPELHKKIAALLEERFYVPVLRSMDSSIPPQIGQPFCSTNPPNLNCDPLSPEVKIQALAGPMNKEQAKKFCRRWKTPPRLGSNASTPIANSPFISPLKSRTPNKTPNTSHGNSSTSTAQRRALFQSTPQRSPADVNVHKEQNGAAPSEVIEVEYVCAVDVSYTDQQNGNHKEPTDDTHSEQQELVTETIFISTCEIKLETNNNNEQEQQLAQQNSLATSAYVGKAQMSMLKTALCPRTPLLKIRKDAFYTYREQHLLSPVVFDAPSAENNSFLGERDLFDTPGFQERHIKITDTEKGLEMIGRELAKEQNVGWREYWDFLNAFIDIASCDGLQQLEVYFAQRVKELNVSKKSAQATTVVLDDVCSALEKFGFGKDVNQAVRNGYSNERQRYGDNSSGTGTSNSGAPQSTTPYTCVEKSLQVFAKRMTKTIIHNIENVVSINDTLLSELKRLKSLICSFKEDVRFLNVNFSKVHSRIGNLVSIYLENSQEVTASLKAKIRNIIKNLLLTPGDRREHIECLCSRILFMLEHPLEQILPENLKTEAMCEKMWQEEKQCECQWETNLSRKTSRRNRMEARYKTHQQAKEQERACKKPSDEPNSIGDGNFEDWRNPSSSNDSSDELEDDVFWSDFGGSDTEEDNEEVWLTPPESPSRIGFMADDGDDERHKIYVYGNEPTKRDLDVLNAIFHIELDKTRYPNIHAWKSALLRHPNEEMDYFPSPSIIKKSHSFIMQSSLRQDISQTTPSQQKKQLQQHPFTPHLPFPQSPSRKKQQQLPTVKRLFMSPSARVNQQNATSASSSSTSTAAAAVQPTVSISAPPQTYRTPLNRIRGLFSSYRERIDSSPMSGASASPAAFMGDRSGAEGSSNLSLLNISAAE